MEDRYRLRDGLTIEELEALVKKGQRREDLRLELELRKDPAGIGRENRTIQISREEQLAAIRQFDQRENRARQKADEEMLKTASPELKSAIENIRALEALLAEKDLEVRRLTALVAKLERRPQSQ
jgi:hypothetical protein